ncbi:MAG: zinc-finger domain-containing protein [Alphaproteobacteria bacterium]|nr:zinc-finger domain-containing protein [Alphaproteobacteria bacterium]
MAIVKRKIFVDQTKIACVGDKKGPHPKVYLKVGPRGFVSCPYCGKLYILAEKKAAGIA